MTDAMTDRVLHPSYPSFSGKKKIKNLFSGKTTTADSLIGFSVNIHLRKPFDSVGSRAARVSLIHAGEHLRVVRGEPDAGSRDLPAKHNDTE